MTAFEELIALLHLSPEQYENNVALKRWCLRNRYIRYIPEELLTKWGVRISSDDPNLFSMKEMRA